MGLAWSVYCSGQILLGGEASQSRSGNPTYLGGGGRAFLRGSSTITVISCSMEGSIDLLSSKVAFLASSIDETTVTACTFVQHSVSSVPELIYVQAHVEEEFDADAGSSLTVGCSGGQQKTMHSYNIASLFALSS